MNRNLLCTSLALTLALALWSPVQAQSAMPADGKMMMEGKKPMDQKMMESHQAMMQRCQTMMAEMKAQDAALTTQVAQMNSAPADQKLDLLAAIVTRLVEQRASMNARMQEMQGQMMMPMPMGPGAMPEHPTMGDRDEKPAQTPETQ